MPSRFQFPSLSTGSWPFSQQIEKALVPLGQARPYLTAFGAAYVTFKAAQAVGTLTRGIFSYGLANCLHLAVDLRKTGDWAVITGASDGIGKEFAHQLAAKGLNIVLIGRNVEKTEAVAQEIRAVYKVLAKIIILDLAQVSADDVKLVQEQLLSLKIALLINNAGVYPKEERFLACPITDEKTVELINVNITGLVLITRAVLPILLSQGKGYIMNISSLLAEKPSCGAALYAASKTFVDYFSQSLDYEYKSKGIRVQSVLCGMVATNILSDEMQKSVLTANLRSFVSSALGLIGVRQRHHGHWKSAVMSHLAGPIPAFRVLDWN